MGEGKDLTDRLAERKETLAREKAELEALKLKMKQSSEYNRRGEERYDSRSDYRHSERRHHHSRSPSRKSRYHGDRDEPEKS
jgi:hypothetical protein